jgi:hypothetical protein
MTKPTLPDVYVEIQDGALGISQGSPENIEVKVGVAAGGAQHVLYSFTNAKQVKDVLQAGPLAEAVAFQVARTGRCIAMKAAASTAGTVTTGAPVKTGSGTVPLTGTPNDAYEVLIEITRAGANIAAGTGAFKYSVDGGDNYSPEIAIPVAGVYVVPGTGITATFTNGGSGTSFQVGDVFSGTSTAPAMTTTDLANALDALLASPVQWAGAHVVGTATPTTAAAVGAKLDAAEVGNRFVYATLEARDIDATTDSGSEDTWMGNLNTEWRNVAHPRLTVCAGSVELTSELSGRSYRRNLAHAYTARLMTILPHQHPGAVELGALSGVTKLYHDEQAKPGLDAARFVTARTIVGLEGFYITAGRMMAPATSDFQSIQHRRVMDKACRVARIQTLPYMNADVPIDAETGKLSETEALAIEAKVLGVLEGDLVNTGNASAVAYRMNRDSNLLSTSSTDAEVRIIPKGYLSWIGLKIGFSNPKLAQR